MLARTILAVVLLLATTAQAIPFDGGFNATGTARFEGEMALDWDLTGATHWADGAETLVVRAPAADVSLHNVQTSHFVQRDPRDGNRSFLVPDVEQLPLMERTVGGVFRIELNPGGAVRVLPADGTFRFHTEGGSMELNPLGSREDTPYESAFAHVQEVDDQGIDARYPHTQALLHGTVGNLTGTLLAVTDATVHLPDGSIQDVPGRRPNEELTTRDPVTGSAWEVYDNHILLLRAPEMALRAPPRWTLAAVSLQGTVDGEAEWRGVSGVLDFGQDRASDPNVLSLAGNLTLEGALRNDEGDWNLQGDVQSVAIDLEPFLTFQVTVVGGLTLLGLLGVAAGLARVLPLAVGRLRDPLESATRRDILAVIHQHQPVPVARLCQDVGIARGTLRYHLSVLESAHIIQRIGAQRNGAYALNGGSLLFRAEQLGADRSDVVVGEALRVAAGHPLRRAAYEHLLLAHEADVETLRRVVHSAHARVADSTLSYHLRQLEEAGVIRHEWRGGRKWFTLAIDARRARAVQYRNYLRKPVWRDTVRHVQDHGALPLEDLCDLLVGQGHALRPARRAVWSLARLQVLLQEAGTIKLNPHVAAAMDQGDTP